MGRGGEKTGERLSCGGEEKASVSRRRQPTGAALSNCERTQVSRLFGDQQLSLFFEPRCCCAPWWLPGRRASSSSATGPRSSPRTEDSACGAPTRRYYRRSAPVRVTADPSERAPVPSTSHRWSPHPQRRGGTCWRGRPYALACTPSFLPSRSFGGFTQRAGHQPCPCGGVVQKMGHDDEAPWGRTETSFLAAHSARQKTRLYPPPEEIPHARPLRVCAADSFFPLPCVPVPVPVLGSC